MQSELLLVAEQDEVGRVIAVWKKAKADRIARPMVRNDLDKASLGDADYYGAPAREIESFIQRLPCA